MLKCNFFFYYMFQKGSLTKYNGIQPSFKTRMKPILRFCMPIVHTHTNDSAMCPDLKKKNRLKKKKKIQPKDPHDFQVKRANKPFIF